jgi:hypothetical protein
MSRGSWAKYLVWVGIAAEKPTALLQILSLKTVQEWTNARRGNLQLKTSMTHPI